MERRLSLTLLGYKYFHLAERQIPARWIYVCTGKFRAMLSMIVQTECNEACFNCRGEAYLMKLSIKTSRTQNSIVIHMFYTAIRMFKG